MAPKKPSESAPRSNKIRFVLVEADISDGNLSELTQAITTALKPSVSRALPPKFIPAQLPANGNDIASETAELDPVVEDTAEQEDAGDSADASAEKPARARAKLPLPKYLADLDLTGNGTSFKQFAEEKGPKSQMKRYLLCALWLRDHGNSPTINTDKVYTLFKTAGWPVGIKDWDANFRGAVKRDLMQRKSAGEYTITPLGEDSLDKAED